MLIGEIRDLKNEVLELRKESADNKELKKEIKEFKQNVKNINKALRYKTVKLTEKEKDEDFRKTFRASQIVKI